MVAGRSICRATNWYGSGRQTTGYSDARAHGGGWAFSEPTPQLTVTGSRADSSEPSSTETSAQHNQTQHNQISWLGTGCAHGGPSAPSPAAVPRVRPSDQRPSETRRSTADPPLCKPLPSATSWLRGDDSAPHWGSCGKPPSPLYVRNGGAVSWRGTWSPWPRAGLRSHRRVTVVSEGSSAWLLATARVDALTSLQASSDPYG